MAGEDIANAKLGFGYMRLPLRNKKFDSEAVNAMVDRFLEHGFSYFDTSYIYQGSEEALRESLVRRHPRDRFQITTKLPVIMLREAKQQEEIFETSRTRLGVDYVDCYFLHGLGGESIKTADRLDTWGYIRGLKERGLTKHLGFSFHGTPDELEYVLANHPEMELVQLQINYLDWDNPAVRSRELYEIARRHNVPISVMEPCKGGLLAGDASGAARLLLDANPNVSTASWAFRYVASLEGIKVILSGMGEMSQLEDNAKTFKTFTPLTEDEHALIKKAVEMINSTPRIPCTSCQYCAPHCPQKIAISRFISIYNDFLVHQDKSGPGYQFAQATGFGTPPSECVKCKVCEKHCPQHIEIADVLEKLNDELAGVTKRYVSND